MTRLDQGSESMSRSNEFKLFCLATGSMVKTYSRGQVTMTKKVSEAYTAKSYDRADRVRKIVEQKTALMFFIGN